MGPVAAVIGAVATVGGTVLQYGAQRQAAKAARKQQELNTQRSNRQAIREAQLRRAEALAAASSMGALGGSAIAGGLGSLGSQLGSGLGFSSQMSSLSADIEKFQQKAAMWGAVAGMGGSLFQAGGGFDGLSTAFNKQPKQAPQPPMVSHAARAGF
ncbi:hypothetical protein EKK58_08170 [Candidatus Dependentiae bacterium]|nr:MAG: hypothetical protein EKK58_08170 [Candidatus Dependentiae bacterium]